MTSIKANSGSHSGHASTVRMDPAVKAKWVAALRSGQYKQGKGGLRVGGSYCCLGVLCVVMDSPDEELTRGTPSRAIWKAAGLANDEGGTVEIGGVITTLAKHNDGCRTFAEIADAIEEQL